MFVPVSPCGACCKVLACRFVSFSTLANIGWHSRRRFCVPCALFRPKGETGNIRFLRFRTALKRKRLRIQNIPGPYRHTYPVEAGLGTCVNTLSMLYIRSLFLVRILSCQTLTLLFQGSSMVILSSRPIFVNSLFEKNYILLFFLFFCN